MQKKKKNTCYAEAERKKLESIFVSCKYQSINRIEQPIAFKERTSAPLFRYLNLVKDRRRIDFFFHHLITPIDIIISRKYSVVTYMKNYKHIASILNILLGKCTKATMASKTNYQERTFLFSGSSHCWNHCI